MRKIITTIAIACAAIVSNGQRDDVTVTSINLLAPSTLMCSTTLDDFRITVSGMLQTTVAGAKITNEDINWSVLPTGAATISNDFAFRAGANGIITVTAMSKRNASIMGSFQVTVSNFVPVTGATILGTGGSISTILGSSQLQFVYEPLTATLPKFSFTNNNLVQIGSDGIVIARNNGVASITLTVSNGGSSTISNAVNYTITGHNGYRETFIGSYGGNYYAKPSTYNVRTQGAAPVKRFGPGPNDLLWFMNNTLYSFTAGTTTGNGWFMTATTTGIPFAPSFIAPWNGGGNDRMMITFNSAGEGVFGGTGLDVLTTQPTLVDVENLSANPMEFAVNIYDNNNQGGNRLEGNGNIAEGNGILYLYTVTGNTRQVLNIPTLAPRNNIKAMGFRTANFNGNLAIHSINIGFDVPTAFSIVPSAGSLVALADNMTVSGVFADVNVIKEVSWTLLNPSTATGLVTLAQLPDLSKTIINYSDFDGKTGVATLVGTMFGSTVTSTLLIEVPTKSAKVQVIHNSPDAPSVDVMVNGLVVAGNVSFHQASGFLDVNLFAPTTVQLALAGTKTVAYTEVFNLSPDMSYRVIASGFATPGSTPGLDLFPSIATTTVTSGNVALDIYHSSPNAPTVGVVARGVATLVSAFSYGGSEMVSVPAGSYILDINGGSAAGSTAASFIAPLSALAGEKVAVLASGNFPTTFGLIAVTSNGTVITLTGLVALTTSTIGGATMVTIAGMSTYSTLGYNPSNATTPINTMWFSSNTAVATIDGMTGVLTALSEGTTDITAKHYNSVNTITSNIITVSVSGTTSISEAYVSSSSVVVSPNPTSDVVSISSSSAVVGVKVYSTTGVLVSSSSSSSVSLAGVSSGLYILEITTANGVVRKTVVKN